MLEQFEKLVQACTDAVHACYQPPSQQLTVEMRIDNVEKARQALIDAYKTTLTETTQPFDLERAKKGEPIEYDSALTGWTEAFFVGVRQDGSIELDVGAGNQSRAANIAPLAACVKLRMKAPEMQTIYINAYGGTSVHAHADIDVATRSLSSDARLVAYPVRIPKV